MTVQDASLEFGKLPQTPPTFETPRFVVVPLLPPKVRELLKVLLQDEPLAKQLPWMEDKSADGAQKEAFLLELQCTTEATKVWGIVERARGMFIGAVIARNTVGSIDIEVLCASPFWNQGVADEAGVPVADWLEDNTEVELLMPH